MKRFITILLSATLLFSAARAQEVGALVDALVDKKVLSPAEAERIRAKLAKEEAETSAGKLKLSNSITELKLYGDARLRYQYDQADAQLYFPAAAGSASATPGSNANVAQRSRWRLRLRIGADFKLGDQFFGGLLLTTNQAADSDNQTLGNGFDKYGIYLSKAFLGWTPTNWLTLVVGKQANPFYTTDLLWDPDINPQGAVEIVDIGKALFPDSKLSVQLIAGQLLFFDNDEFRLGHDNSTDAWLFQEQVKLTYKFNSDTSLTFAPGILNYTAASLSGLLNTRAFSAPQDNLGGLNFTPVQTTTTDQRQAAIQIKYDKTGVPTVTVTPTDIQTTTQVTTPATGSPRVVTTTGSRVQQSYTANPNGAGNVVADPAHGVPFVAKNAALKNQTITTTKILSNGTTVVTSAPTVGVGGETRDLSILTLPGDFSFKVGGLKSKLYWDVAYNFDGGKRYSDIYLLKSPYAPQTDRHSSQDDLAWLVGLQVGDNKRAGDWSLFANYREVGISSIDPNINDSDIALSALNIRAIRTGLTYNLTDWLTGSLTYSHAWNLKKNVIGGEATGGAAIADLNDVDVVQVDLNWKF